MDCKAATTISKLLFRECSVSESEVEQLIEHISGCSRCFDLVRAGYAKVKLLGLNVLEEIENSTRPAKVKLVEGHYSAFELVFCLDKPLRSPIFARVARHLESCHEGCGELLIALKRRREVFQCEFNWEFRRLLYQEVGY